MTEKPYPILAETALAQVPRRLFRGTERDLADLPTAQPGSVLVFEVGGHYEVVERRHLSGREPAVLDAVAVSLVDMRPRLVSVDLSVPSASAADDFVFRAGFSCEVTRPEVVAAAGLTDVGAALRTYLAQDHKLVPLGANFTVDQLAVVREEVAARIFAYCEGRPPVIGGMRVDLRTVEVFTPDDLRAQETKLRDERWAQTLNRLALGGEQQVVEVLAAPLADPVQAQAIAVARGEMTAADAAQRAAASQAQKEQQLLEMLRVLQHSGHLDTVSADAEVLVDSLAESLTGRAPTRTEIPAARREIADDDAGPELIDDEDEPRD